MTEASCPNCGEPVDSRQLVCLNCGARVALRERTSWAREPVTAVAAVLVVVIVIGAGLFGFAISELTSDDGDEPTRAAAHDDQPRSRARRAGRGLRRGAAGAHARRSHNPQGGLTPLRVRTACPAGPRTSALTRSCS